MRFPGWARRTLPSYAPARRPAPYRRTIRGCARSCTGNRARWGMRATRRILVDHVAEQRCGARGVRRRRQPRYRIDRQGGAARGSADHRGPRRCLLSVESSARLRLASCRRTREGVAAAGSPSIVYCPATRASFSVQSVIVREMPICGGPSSEHLFRCSPSVDFRSAGHTILFGVRSGTPRSSGD